MLGSLSGIDHTMELEWAKDAFFGIINTHSLEFSPKYVMI